MLVVDSEIIVSISNRAKAGLHGPSGLTNEISLESSRGLQEASIAMVPGWTQLCLGGRINIERPSLSVAKNPICLPLEFQQYIVGLFTLIKSKQFQVQNIQVGGHLQHVLFPFLAQVEIPTLLARNQYFFVRQPLTTSYDSTGIFLLAGVLNRRQYFIGYMRP